MPAISLLPWCRESHDSNTYGRKREYRCDCSKYFQIRDCSNIIISDWNVNSHKRKK